MARKNPQEWINDPQIAAAARAGGWDRFTGNLALLSAIIATESEGDTMARSEDNCVGLVQFLPRQQKLFEQHKAWGPQIREALAAQDIARPTTRASWFDDPRSSVVYGGFVLQDQFDILSRARAGKRDNLFLALQGYNGGYKNLMSPEAVHRESREYPEKIAAYLKFHAVNDATPE